MLQQLFKKEEYILTLFLSNCDKNEEACDEVLDELEQVSLKPCFNVFCNRNYETSVTFVNFNDRSLFI